MIIFRTQKTKRKKKVFIKHTLFLAGIFSLFSASVLTGWVFSAYLQTNDARSEAQTVAEAAEKINSLCKESKIKDQCYGNAFHSLTKANNSKYAVDVLENLQRINSKDANGCHFMAHRISQAEVEKNPKDWQMILKEISPSLCTGGFLHGVLEAHMATNPEFTINEQSFKMICDDVYSSHKTWFAWRGCVHNMGHLMLVEKEGNIQKAVEDCNHISHTGTKYECLSGAFMERITAENLIAHGIQKNRQGWDNEEFVADTENLCAQYAGMPAQACWKVISYLYFAVSNHGPVGLYEKCQRAPTPSMRDECFIYGAGNIVVTTRFDQADLYTVCHQLPPHHPLFERCMNQILGSLLTNTSKNAAKTISLCETTYPSYKKPCMDRIIDVLEKNKTREETVKDICASIKKSMHDYLCIT